MKMSACPTAVRAVAAVVLCVWASGARPSPPVLQRGYDNFVSGANLYESVLNTSNVRPGSFGWLFDMAVDDNVFAQPLFVPSLTVNGKTQPVVLVATMSDTVYAFPAASAGSPLWSINLAKSVGATPVPMSQFAISGNRNIVGNLGILSTPVIDPATHLMYVVAATVESGTIVYRLHAIDITKGTEPLAGGVVISGSSGGFSFDGRYAFQRPSLVLFGASHVVVCFGALELEFANGYTGWLMLYDKSTLTRTAVFATVPSGGNGGGVWQSGRPPAIDGAGHVLVFTGNGYRGGYNGVNDFSESLLKLDGSLKLVDWFTPGNWQFLDSNDLDLSSSGPMRIPGTSNPALIAGGGKNGILYILNANNLGKYNANDSQVVQKQQVSSGELRGGPVFWQRPPTAGGSLLYVWGAGDVLKAWAFDGTRIGTTPVSQATVGPQSWPGGILALSAHGSTAGTGVLWANVATSGDAENNPPVPGALYAFDASNVATELWSSNMDASRDAVGNFAKFVPPLVVGGKVYLATQSKKVRVYGLLH